MNRLLTVVSFVVFALGIWACSPSASPLTPLPTPTSSPRPTATRTTTADLPPQRLSQFSR